MPTELLNGPLTRSLVPYDRSQLAVIGAICALVVLSFGLTWIGAEQHYHDGVFNLELVYAFGWLAGIVGGSYLGVVMSVYYFCEGDR